MRDVSIDENTQISLTLVGKDISSILQIFNIATQARGLDVADVVVELKNKITSQIISQNQPVEDKEDPQPDVQAADIA